MRHISKDMEGQPALSERMSRRDRERKDLIEKRREEHQHQVVESEQLVYFKDTFQASCKRIRELLDTATATPVPDLPPVFDQALKEVELLKNYLSQSKMFLKVYDIRKAQERLQSLENEALELEEKLVPKKKFGFKNQRRLGGKTRETALLDTLVVADGLKCLKLVDDAPRVENNALSNFPMRDDACVLREKCDEKLVLDAENINKNDILLSGLTRCMVRVYGNPSTLHMVNLKNCTVLVGPVTSSVFVHDCANCVFAFACQQLRLHSSSACTIYLHVTSRAIIEDCSEIKVAPYNWTYEDQASHFNLAGLDPKINNWNCVDDFNWLSSEKSSPNWSILEPEYRVQSWD